MIRRAFLHAVVAAGLIVPFRAWSAPAKADVPVQAREMRVAVKGLTEDLYGILGLVSKRDPKALDILRLELPGAVSKEKLTIDIVLARGKVLFAYGFSPRWNTAVHPVKPGRYFKLSGNAKSGTIKGKLPVTLRFDGFFPLAGNSVNVSINLNGVVRGGKVSGSFSVPGTKALPGAKGKLSGTMGPITPRTVPVALVDKPYEGANHSALYAAALDLERDAGDLYHMARALVVAASYNVSFEEALRDKAGRRPVRPQFEVSKQGKAGKNARVVAPPDVGDDDLGLDLGLEDVGGDDSGGGAAESDLPDAALPVMRDIRDRMVRMRTAASRQRKAGLPEPVTGEIADDPDDPLFGPWFPSAALPGGKKGPHDVPATRGGGQKWSFVGNWQVAGPFVRTLPVRHVRLMPDVIESAVGEYISGQPMLALPGARLEDEPRPKVYVKWRRVEVEKGSGRARVPRWVLHPEDPEAKGAEFVPLRRCSFYARTELKAPRDMEVWLCLYADQYQRLWVNDELAVRAPAEPHRSAMADIREPQKALVPHSTPGYDHASRLVFRKVALRKGVNSLLLCVDNDIGGMGFAAHVCTSGTPRKAARTAATTEPEPWLPANIRGWRGQWNGRFPGAKPPLAWDLEERINILWRTPIPLGSGGAVVAGERIITQWEPHGIVCTGKADGKLLWKRECNVLELIDKKLVAEYDRLLEAHKEAIAELDKLGSGPEERTAALREGGLSAAEAQTKLRELDLAARDTKQAWERFFMQKGGLAAVTDPAHNGYAMPTPATDGKLVWAKFGTGVLACYDLDGNRNWMKSLGRMAAGSGMYNSPLLMENRLVVVVNAPGRGEGDPGPVHMLCLDPASGKQRWRTKIFGTATPVPMRLKLGNGTLDLVVSGCGRLVRADDGKVLCRVPVPLSGNRAPTPCGDMVYFNASQRMIGVQLIPRSRDSIGVRLLWDLHVLHADRLAALARAAGQVYGYARRQPAGAVEACNALTGADARTLGSITWSKPAGGTIPLSVAGGNVFIADDGSSHYAQWPRESPGSMSVLRPGVPDCVVARNRIEAMNGPPAFDGDRIYLRARNALMCIGYTGDEGRSYEAREVAGNLLDSMYPERPVRNRAIALVPLEVKPKTRYPRHGSLPVADPPPRARSRGKHVSLPRATRAPGWLFAGTFPLKDRDAVRASLGDLEKFRAHMGKTVTAGGKTKRFNQLGKRAQETTATGYRLDLLSAVYGEAGTVSYYYARVHNPGRHTYRLELKPKSVRFWIQGVELKHQQRVTLPAGHYALLMEVPVPEPAPEMLMLSLQFWRSDDQDREIANWEAAIRKNRGPLETACAWAHGSDAAERSASLLKALPDWRPPKVAFRVEEKKTRTAGTFAPSPVVLGKAVDKRIEWRDARLELEGALSVHCRVTDGKWEPTCWPRDVVLPFAGRFRWRHSGKLDVTVKGAELDMALEAKLAVHRSRTGTNATFRIKATRADDGKVTGTYTGEFGGKDLSGKVTGLVEEPWPGLVKGWDPVAPCEHPRIMFRKKNLPALRKRMATPEGKAIIAQTKKLLDGRFNNGHPAAYGLLWHLTGDKIWALKCRAALDELLAGRVGIDARYHFTQPNGQLRAGPTIGVVALAYDLGYDSFDEAYRQKVANRLLNHWYTEQIVNSPRHGAGCNHYGAHQGGIGTALLAIRDDPGVDSAKVEDWLEKVLFRGRQGGARSEMEHGFSRYGYYYEGHHCGRISKTGLFPFIHALRTAGGLDCGEGLTNVQWMLTRWVYEFIQINGKCNNLQRGMYCRPDFKQYSGWSGDGDFALGFGFTPKKYLGALKWVYNHLVEPDPATREYSAWRYSHLGAWAFVTWPIGIDEQNPREIFPRVHHDPDPGYFVFRNDWTGTENDVVVTALLGSKPGHGRGMAQGGSVEVLGMGLRARFPGAFHHDRMTYFEPEKDGSGVLSAEGLDAGKKAAKSGEKTEKKVQESEKTKKDEPGEEKGILEEEIMEVKIPEKTAPPPPEKKERELTPHEKAMQKAIAVYRKKDRLTSLAVDYSGRCGAPVLIAMTGRRLGRSVAYWMQLGDGMPSDVKADNGAFTKTTGVIANGRPYYVMTVQKGKAPPVEAQGDKVMVGGLALHFDGEKLVLSEDQ